MNRGERRGCDAGSSFDESAANDARIESPRSRGVRRDDRSRDRESRRYLDNWIFRDTHFMGGEYFPLGVYAGAADYSTEKTRTFLESYADEPYVVASSLENNWHAAHAAWASEHPTASSDYDASVAEFLETSDGLAYKKFVVFDEDGTIRATRVDALWQFKGNEPTTARLLRRLTKSREAGRDAGAGLGPRFYSGRFVFAEGIKAVLRESIFSMSLACATVGAILLLLLGDAVAAALVGSMVVLVCLVTYGSIYWYADHLNNVSGFFVIISVGLASDASAHYCHAFLESRKPTARERAVDALDLLGPSIFLGGTSTILGICITGFCLTYVFQVFFRYLMTILVLSLWFGLAVMPVACALLAPRARHAPAAAPLTKEESFLDDALEGSADAPLALTGAPAGAEGLDA